MDFTRNKYRELISQLQQSGYEFITYADYCRGKLPLRFVILRHDVDLKPYNSYSVATTRKRLGQGPLLFSGCARGWDEKIIRRIHQLGHEIGYHYESLTTCKGDVQMAFADLKKIWTD